MMAMSDHNNRDDLAERRRNKLKVLQFDKSSGMMSSP